MKHGWPLLLDALRGDRPRFDMDEDDWQETLRLAETEGCAPWFLASVRAGNYALPHETEHLFQAAERAATLAAFFWTAELKGLLHAFAAAGIPLIPLKGPSFAERVYGASALRPSRDLDLLIRAPDLPQAERLLRVQAFQPTAPRDDYHQPWHRATTPVELHFDVENPLAFNFQVAAVWQRARPASFAGASAWLMHPADELRFLALHGTRHRWDRLSLILDFALARRTLKPESRVPHVSPHISPLRRGSHELPPPEPAAALQGSLTLAHLLADRLFPHQPQAPPAAAPYLHRLAEDLWRHLETEEAEDLDWHAQHRFYLRLEPNARARLAARLRHARILAARLIEPDHRFAGRLGLTRPWQARLLRPLRLLLHRRA